MATLYDAGTAKKTTKKDKLLSLRVDSAQLKRLNKALGVDDSKSIRACMNFTENVIHHWFGGNLTYLFRRKKNDEEQSNYNMGRI